MTSNNRENKALSFVLGGLPETDRAVVYSALQEARRPAELAYRRGLLSGALLVAGLVCLVLLALSAAEAAELSARLAGGAL